MQFFILCTDDLTVRVLWRRSAPTVIHVSLSMVKIVGLILGSGSEFVIIL